MMGQLSSTLCPSIHHAHIWRRRMRRPWARPRDAGHAAGFLEQIPSLPRAALARIATALIDWMDEIDGDPDLEDNREDLEDGHDREQAYD